MRYITVKTFNKKRRGGPPPPPNKVRVDGNNLTECDVCGSDEFGDGTCANGNCLRHCLKWHEISYLKNRL
jgi:hypothetical protein